MLLDGTAIVILTYCLAQHSFHYYLLLTNNRKWILVLPQPCPYIYIEFY